jgi:hypothetical protein
MKPKCLFFSSITKGANMITIALLAVPKGLDINLYLSPGESMGYFKSLSNANADEGAYTIDPDSIRQLHGMIESTPFALNVGLKRVGSAVCNSYINIIRDLGLLLEIRKIPISKYEQDFGVPDQHESFASFVFINLFNFINNKEWVSEIVGNVVRAESYAEETRELMERFS